MGRQGDNNEYAKAGTLRALESKLAQEMKTQEKRLREEIERQAERHRLERDADARNADLERRLRRIGNVLHATLTSSPPTLADVCAARPRTERNLQDVLPPEPREADFTPSGYGLLPIGRRYRDAVDKAEDERAAALRDWRRSTDEIRRQHDRLVSAENAAMNEPFRNGPMPHSGGMPGRSSSSLPISCACASP